MLTPFLHVPCSIVLQCTPGILAVFGPRLGFRGACPPKGRAHAEFPTLAKHDRFQLEASATPESRKPLLNWVSGTGIYMGYKVL